MDWVSAGGALDRLGLMTCWLGRSSSVCTALISLFVGLAFVATASAGQPPPGAFSTPFTTFRGSSSGLKMYVDLVEERIGFGAHGRVACANGSEHWQLVVEGGLGGKVDAGGHFQHTEYEPAEPGEKPPSTERATSSVTIEDVEESIVYGVPAFFTEVKGRVLSNTVVGWIRFWEGPGRTPGSLHYKCGTGSPDGKWEKFVVHRVNGPAQPHGHWPPSKAAPAERKATSPALPQAFCQTPPAQAKGEPPSGFFRVRPHGCRFHQLGLSSEENNLADLTFRIHWRRWTAASASGIGRQRVFVVNYKTHKHSLSSAPVVMRLSRPRRVCGHQVFTELEMRAYLGGNLVNNYKADLNELGPAEEGCPQAR